MLSIVDCTWDTWSAWGSCDVTCGGGTQERTRVQDSPAENGGAACEAVDATDTQNCSTNGCPGKFQSLSYRNHLHLT